ncbi:MAG: hypothetical protein IT317_18595 [Anaerolineales bacterium]|nr:hypothetical protein [Anaerolineales bacterium]
MGTWAAGKAWWVKLSGALLAAALTAGLALAPAYAAPAAVAAERPAPTLETLYQREQNWLTVQTTTLTNANSIAVNMQNWIDTLKRLGKDTTDLETALASFNGAVASAQTRHNAAAGTLAAHAGFDANGTVTDRAQAAATVRSAYDNLQAAHLTLVGAVVDLRLAVRTWRLNH